MEFTEGDKGKPLPLHCSVKPCFENKITCEHKQVKVVHTLNKWNVRWATVCSLTGMECNGK